MLILIRAAKYTLPVFKSGPGCGLVHAPERLFVAKDTQMKRLRHSRASLIAVLLSANVMRTTAHAQEAGKCSESFTQRTIDGELVEDYGFIGVPLRGWVGYTTGSFVAGMTIDAYTEDGKKRLASTTTDASGAFSFPQLKPATYYLKGSGKGLISVRFLVHVSEGASTIACIVE